MPDTLYYLGDSAFYKCTGLEGDIIIPDSVTYLGDYLFDYCGYCTNMVNKNNKEYRYEIIENFKICVICNKKIRRKKCRM